MVEQHIHRVFVQDGERLTGVVAIRELLDALVASEVELPLADFAHRPVVTLDADAPLGRATEALAPGGMRAIVVVEDGVPVGLVGRLEALLHRRAPPETALRRVMHRGIVVLPPSASLRHGAIEALRNHQRQVVLVEEGRIVGIVGSLDFARAVADL